MLARHGPRGDGMTAINEMLNSINDGFLKGAIFYFGILFWATYRSEREFNKRVYRLHELVDQLSHRVDRLGRGRE
jgi:hypothetical protein